MAGARCFGIPGRRGVDRNPGRSFPQRDRGATGSPHSAHQGPSFRRLAERECDRGPDVTGRFEHRPTGLDRDAYRCDQTYKRWIEAAPRIASTARFFDVPGQLLGSRVLVLKSSGPRERGVVLIDYNFTIPLFAQLFDLEAVARRYLLVLEPGWSGYCTLDILCYRILHDPVLVQAYEPRDADFLREIGSNLHPFRSRRTGGWITGFSDACRTSERMLTLLWLRAGRSYKRHERLFSALRQLKRRGLILRSILIGYPIDRTCTRSKSWPLSTTCMIKLNFMNALS